MVETVIYLPATRGGELANLFVNMEKTLHFPCKVVKDIGSIMVDMMCSKDPLSAGNQMPKRNRRKKQDPLM